MGRSLGGISGIHCKFLPGSRALFLQNVNGMVIKTPEVTTSLSIRGEETRSQQNFQLVTKVARIGFTDGRTTTGVEKNGLLTSLPALAQQGGK